METLAANFAKILSVLAFFMKEKEIREVVTAVCETLKRSPSATCKRACADIAAAICKSYPRPEWEYCIVTVRPLLSSEEASVVQGGLVFLTALAREAAVFNERPFHRDPRVPLVQFGPQLIAIAEQGLTKSEAPLVWQAAAELCARLPMALPWAVELRRVETRPLRRALRALAFNTTAGASRRASALQALAAWGGLNRRSESEAAIAALLLPDEDPLVRGSALLALAKRRAVSVAVVLEATKDESSVVARLAFEAAAEFVDSAQVARSIVTQAPCEYWVVEKQRLAVIGGMGRRLVKMPLDVRVGALQTLFGGLENSDPRIRTAAAEALADAALYLGPCGESSVQSDNDVVLLEGAWRSVPAVMHQLLARSRCVASPHALLGTHEALSRLARKWCSPRRYLRRESARMAAAQQRPLHSSWPSPLQGMFASYGARAVSEMVARPATLMVALDHHQHVLLCCAALARGGGASSSSSWPAVLLHCLRVARLYDPTLDPMDAGDDTEVLCGGGLPYVALQVRLAALRSSSLPSETGVYFDLLKASLKVVTNLALDISRPIATFGHLILTACRMAMPLVPSACLNLCRAIAPLCFRPATAPASAASVFSPGAAAGASASTPAASQAKPLIGLSVPPGLAYASGLGRPALVAEDFPAALKFSAQRVEVALRMRPLLPGMLEPLVLRAMDMYPKVSSFSVKLQSRTLDLAVTLVRCGVDYRRLDPKASLVACIQQQILGKRAYLKDPVRIMPSMYTFLGVLVTDDLGGGGGQVDGNLLMQVATPVFTSPYWRSNARLLPSLRWMLRDLFVRRRMQLQKEAAGAAAVPDTFADVRAHFVSCLLSKLPHEEAVEQLEALIRAARPVKSLVEEIAVPTLLAVKAYASSGKLLVWRAAQWSAWKALAARIVQQRLPPPVAPAAAPELSLVLDAEDPNAVVAEACAPLGVLAGLLLLQRLEVPQDKAVIHHALARALESPGVQACAPEALGLMRKEAEAGGPKRALFSGEVQSPLTQSPSPAASVSPAPMVPVSGLLIEGLDVVRPRPGPGALNLKTELPLLKVESVSSSTEIPDELYPLADALFRHSAKLLHLRSRLSRAELDQILMSAEALALADPERNLRTDQALECLRGAILRPASTAMLTSSSQCCPRNDQLKITIMPLWKLEDESAASLTTEPRALVWRRALSHAWSDEDDTLIGMVPQTVPPTLPTPAVPGTCSRAYGIMCRIMRDPPASKTAAVVAWARQWQAWSKVAVIQAVTAAVLESAGGSEPSSMDSHERADQMLRSTLPQVYCVDAPKLLLGEALSAAQAVSLLMAHLIRCVRADVDLVPVTHVILKVLPGLAAAGDVGLHLYVPSIRDACSAQLFPSLLAFLCLCILGKRLEAHQLSHALFRANNVNSAAIAAQLAATDKPELKLLHDLLLGQGSRSDLLISF
jgi:hypothetical protein